MYDFRNLNIKMLGQLRESTRQNDVGRNSANTAENLMQCFRPGVLNVTCM